NAIVFGAGCDTAWRYLPPREEALSRFAAFGMSSLAIPKSDAGVGPRPNLARRLRRWARHLVDGRPSERRSEDVPPDQRDLPYPLAYGMSAFFVVRDDALMKFSQYCGVLAALDIFVEVAIPTALVLACEKLATGTDTSLRYKWTYTSHSVNIGAQ